MGSHFGKKSKECGIITLVDVMQTASQVWSSNQDSNSPWAKDGSRWVCKVVSYPATYLTAWLLVRHFAKDHDMFVQLDGFNCPST
jgi:hypothetical protein